MPRCDLLLFGVGRGGQRGPQPGDTGVVSQSTPQVVQRPAPCSPQPGPGVSSGTCGFEIPAGGQRLSGEALGGPQDEAAESSRQEGFTRLPRRAGGAGRPGGERRLQGTREEKKKKQNLRLEMLGGALGGLLRALGMGGTDGSGARAHGDGDGDAGGVLGACWRRFWVGGSSPAGVVHPDGVIQKRHRELAGVGVPGEGAHGAAGPAGTDGGR